ncbi:MAG: hypothetical protein DMG19_15930 [Acidobacteria bacterium]|nr:MAG: hypothetical protein DMG19_15930 [Acidobacteriota bacterium]
MFTEVVRIEVNSRADVLAGKSFGTAGPYERLSGKIYFAVDPRNSANQIVTDIDKAPKNASGKVEFSSDFFIIKPKDLTRGNGSVLYEVSNRGNKGMLGFFDFASASTDPQNAQDFGDGFLLEQGFTLLWVGWQFDVPNRDNALRAYLPVAREPDGRPIRGPVRSDFEPVDKIFEASLADRGHMAYAVADPKDPRLDRTRFRRWPSPDNSSKSVGIHRRRTWRSHGLRLRAEEDLRSRVQIPGSSDCRTWFGQRPRHDFATEIRLCCGAFDFCWCP